MPDGTLVIDIETHSANLLYTMGRREFVRLSGYWWVGRQDPVLTTDVDEIRDQVRKAAWIIGHNIHSFDLPAIFGVRSDEPIELADQGRVFDTFTHATLVNPAPDRFTNRHGKEVLSNKPELAMRWYGLDEQAYQLGVTGKTADLDELALEFAPGAGEDYPLMAYDGLPVLDEHYNVKMVQPNKNSRIQLGYGLIPVGDKRYREYLIGDLHASWEVALAQYQLGKKLGIDMHPGAPGSFIEHSPTWYAKREQQLYARLAVITANGVRVLADRAQARVDELAQRRGEVMHELVENYDFPTDGKSPWASAAGKSAILAVLAEQGITEHSQPDWPRTDKGSLKLGGKELIDVVKSAKETRTVLKASVYTDEWGQTQSSVADAGFGRSEGVEVPTGVNKAAALEFVTAIAELKGQRSLAQLTLDSMHADGFVHPRITVLQASGRASTTKPGLTIWDKKSIEKSYFGADNDQEVLLEFDLNAADARAVAAYSGDREYAKRFEPGVDGHLISAWAAFGRDVVGEDKHDPITAEYRNRAKPMIHGWSYGGGYKTLAAETGVPLENCKAFCEGMANLYRGLVSWQGGVRKMARSTGGVKTLWGRFIPVDQARIYTQAPALMGQNFTREVMVDLIIELPMFAIRKFKVWNHDAAVFSVPEDQVEAWQKNIIRIMTRHYEPQGGQPMDFPAESGPPGRDWLEASHG